MDFKFLNKGVENNDFFIGAIKRLAVSIYQSLILIPDNYYNRNMANAPDLPQLSLPRQSIKSMLKQKLKKS